MLDDLTPAQAPRLASVHSLRSPLGEIRTIDAPLSLPKPQPPRSPAAEGPKLLQDLDAAFDAADLRDGAVLSFHHHFRTGDRAIVAVLEHAGRRGLRNLTVAASSIFPSHAALVPLVERGVIGTIITNYIRGPVADAIMAGALPSLALLQTHGGRARAITSGQLKIDAAFIAAPVATGQGAASGRMGPLACGPLGYAMVDAAYARRTIVLADQIGQIPATMVDIPEGHVDHIVPFKNPGLPSGIASGATVPQTAPAALRIAENVVSLIRAAGLMKDGLSFQTGAGGFSLAAVPPIGRAMAEAGILGSFVSGGITGAHVDLLANGQVKRIRDVQCFDLAAVQSSANNTDHLPMSAAAYASPIHPNPIVDDLDVMLLGATEVDRDFNVNVVLGGDGRIIGGPGGHPDTAAGAKLAIVTTRLAGGGYPKIVDQACCISTPGAHIDAVATDVGVALAPGHEALGADLRRMGVNVLTIDDMVNEATACTSQVPRSPGTRACALIEARDGRILDVVTRTYD